MPEARSNGHLARNALLLAAVAAGCGCGWLLYSQAETVRRRLNGGGLAEGAVERVRKLAARQPPHPAPRKISVEEPMAGYGA
jgi:hypothetical protein